MGASQSTRNITLVNDESSGVIKLSESLAQRLRGQLIESSKSSSPNIPSPPPPEAQEKIEESSPIESAIDDSAIPSSEPPAPIITSEPPAPIITSEPPAPIITSEPPAPITTSEDPIPIGNVEIMPPQPNNNGSFWPSYAEEANLALLRLKEEKEESLKLQENEWRTKLANREAEYMNQSQLTKENFNNSVLNVDKLLTHTAVDLICQDHQQEVLDCFNTNPNQPLRCGDAVAKFNACVSSSQLDAVKNHRSP